MDVEQAALSFATEKHAGQARKYSGVPYISHPTRVGQTLREYGYPPEVVAAGYLHDVLEDTSATEEELRSIFGDRVTNLVKEVTNDKEKMADLGKGAYQAQKITSLSRCARAIKLADRLDNVQDLRTIPDKTFAKRYSYETLDMIKALWSTSGYLSPSIKDMAWSILSCLEPEVTQWRNGKRPGVWLCE